MAIGDPYISVEDYRAETGQRAAAGNDAVLLRQLLGVSRYIDDRLGFPGGFNKDATATTRLYVPEYNGYGSAPTVLDIEAVADLTGAAVTIDTDGDGSFADETALASTEYRFLPLNAATGPEPRPYRQLEVTSWGSQGAWPVGRLVRVSAIHGWPAVPNRIVIATVELTRLLRTEGMRATLRINEATGDVLTLSRRAQSIIDELIAYFHPTGIVVA